MNTPEFHRIYSPAEFNSAWLETYHTDDIIPVYLPTIVMVKEPAYVVPFAARVFQTRYFLLDGTLQHEDESLGMKGELPKNLRNRKSVVLCELWEPRGDGREHTLRGYVFLSELEFIGDSQSSVIYDQVSKSEDFKN